jgi:hypothetical protein
VLGAVLWTGALLLIWRGSRHFTRDQLATRI